MSIQINDTFHVLAFESALGVAATDAQVNAIKETPFGVDSSNKFIVPDKLYLWGAYYAAASAIRARINTASRRIRGFPQIVPFNRSLLWSGNEMPFMDMCDFPLPLEPLENIEIDGSNNLGAATENSYCLLFVSKHQPPRQSPPSLARWVRFTAAVTAVASAWSAPTLIVPQDQLEGGHYEVWGMTAQETNGIATRLIWPRGTLYKPGTVCMAALGLNPPDFFQGCKIGPWGDFDTYAFPQVEHLGNVAGATTVEIQLLLAKND